MAGHIQSLVWLPTSTEASSPKAASHTLIRARAAAWSHRTGTRPRNTHSAPWQTVQCLTPGHFIKVTCKLLARFRMLSSSPSATDQFCQSNGDTTVKPAGLNKRESWPRKAAKRKRSRVHAQSPQPLLLEPVFSNDEKFGRHLHFVLPRFRAIAGEDGIAWLTAVAQIKEDVLLHEALKALVIGLDSTSKHSAQRRYCADVLSSTRLHLSHYSTQATHSTVMLTFLLSFHELLVWNNAKSWMMHLWGMSQFVRAMGPQAFTSPLTLMTFRWFRHFSVSFPRKAAFAL